MGALLFRSLLRFAGKVWAERKPIAAYDCADDTQRPGGLWHGSGNRVAVDPIATSRRSWEHAPQTAGSDHPHSIYGPHVNDFGKPGYYRVTFRIYGSGFTGIEEPVIIADIIQRPMFLGKDLVMLSQRVIRGKELSNEYRDFDVFCYASGTGTYEYRCLVHSEAFDQEKHTIRFDCIKVFVHIPVWEIL